MSAILKINHAASWQTKQLILEKKTQKCQFFLLGHHPCQQCDIQFGVKPGFARKERVWTSHSPRFSSIDCLQGLIQVQLLTIKGAAPVREILK